MSKKAVVLTSGGLDSATCLALASAEGYDILALSFDYGQLHSAELEAAKRLAKTFNARHQIFIIDLTQIGGSALTDTDFQVPTELSEGIPITYVPARNTIMLSVALGFAEVSGAETIVIGVNAVDYSGYPDCRPEYIQAFETMARIATKTGVEGAETMIRTPLIHLSKAEIIQMGTELGVDYSLTTSCYQADTKGRACGQCDACRIRAQGFIQAGIEDPTIYQ